MLPPPLQLQRQLPRLPRSAPAAPRDGRGIEKGRARSGRGRGVHTSSHGILGLPGAPPAGRGWGRGACDSGRPHRIPCKQQRRLGRSGGVAGATPPPARLGGGVQGRGPSALIGSQQVRPAHGLGRIPPRSASAGYCYNPGFPGATGMGRDSEHLAPPSTPEWNAQPPDSGPLAFTTLRNLVGLMMELAFVP